MREPNRAMCVIYGSSRRLAHNTPITLELEQLHSLSRSELQERWKTAFGQSPPPKIDRSLLIDGVAYRLQERLFGGLRPAARRALAQIAQQVHDGKSVNRSRHGTLRVGTILVREWHGTTHQVTVLEDGFEFENRRFGSLSEIARAITGTRWSGPLFFGLKREPKERSDGRD